jgi:RNA polymerase sigma-70 factor (ECF subfamily)
MDLAPQPAIETEVIDTIPRLHAYARVLTRDANDADDLVQETFLKALSNIHSFQRGTMLRAWLFTIMRNSVYTNVKERALEKPGAEDCVSGFLTVQPDHDRPIQAKRMMTAIENLPHHCREILILVVMPGESYEDAATLCGVAAGTVKSRVKRARRLVMDEIGGGCPSGNDRAVIQRGAGPWPWPSDRAGEWRWGKQSKRGTGE